MRTGPIAKDVDPRSRGFIGQEVRTASQDGWRLPTASELAGLLRDPGAARAAGFPIDDGACSWVANLVTEPSPGLSFYERERTCRAQLAGFLIGQMITPPCYFVSRSASQIARIVCSWPKPFVVAGLGV